MDRQPGEQPDGSYFNPGIPGFTEASVMPAHAWAAIKRGWSEQARGIREEMAGAAERDRTQAEARGALEAEKQMALDWCRANGSPHLAAQQSEEKAS